MSEPTHDSADEPRLTEAIAVLVCLREYLLSLDRAEAKELNKAHDLIGSALESLGWPE